MGLFNLFKKKTHLTEEQKKWNHLWELWSREEIGSPYDALMTYDSEINNGGHIQFFLNVAACGEVEKAVNNLCEALPEMLKDNLQTAYSHYLVLINEENEETEGKILECDAVFHENEKLITDILQEYANTLEIY